MEPVLAELTSATPMTIGVIAIAITLAGLLLGTTGVGYGLIAGPVLALVEPSFVPGAVLVTGLSVTALTSLRELQQVNRSLLVAGVAGRVPGALLGAFLAAYLAPAWFGIAFGGMILLAVMISITSRRFVASVVSVGTAGVVSGVMGTLTGVGAAPMAIVMQNQPGPEMRATTSAFLLFGAILSILALSLFGRFGWMDVLRGAILVPFCLLGFWLSGPLIALKSFQKFLRPLVLAVCALMSCILLWRSVVSLLEQGALGS